MGDLCEIRDGLDPNAIDSDQDQVNDGTDNCPLISNEDQQDLDLDGIGSACDLDESSRDEHTETLFDQDSNEEEDFEIPAFLRKQKF